MKESVYDIITNRIIELLEKGVIPWRKPWRSSGKAPVNLVSGKEYRGINRFLLNSAGYSSPYWLTFKQAKAKGGNVKKGEKGMPVVYWSAYIKKDKDETGEETEKKIFLCKYYTVFHASQTEGIEIPEIKPETNDIRPIDKAEIIIKNMPNRPKITNCEDRAYYRPSTDTVNVPSMDLFETAEEYYSTMYHEICHSSGHGTRLNREGITEFDVFGSERYSKEELLSEMGASFLCDESGILNRTIKNSAAYVASWLYELKNDKRLVITAAAQAQKAVDYILGKPEYQNNDDVESDTTC